ncbi:thioredoxin [Bacteroidales bacterium OttesenSCG-928-K03]|nr:thioredoxin [Odoribacter sp. OttesenSCG-928-L07]MDL2242316.1 thioredoxin [Bacteroidales bacterium OttesenSCG-928-K03]
MKTIKLTKEDFSKKITDLDKNSNDWTYLGDKPALIDFYADWCSPCRMLAPILEELAEEYKDEIYIYKVDTEENKELTSIFNIRGIPTMIFSPVNNAPQMVQGALPRNELKRLIDEILLNSN